MTKGLHCSRSAFYQLVRRPVYCGKIVIPQNKESKSRIIEGTHKKIVSVILFDKVQEILGKRRIISQKKDRSINEKFILRGVLVCPDCGKTLTASTCQGSTKKYDYYHCYMGCRYRVRADYLNLQFLTLMKNLKLEGYYAGLNACILKETYSERHTDFHHKKLLINREINKLIDRSLNAQHLFSKGEIDYDDYILIKENCKKSLNNYTKQIQEHALDLAAGTFGNDRQQVLLNHLGNFYESSDIIIKQKIVRLFFPKKVVVDNKNILNMLSESIKMIFGLNDSKRETIQDPEHVKELENEISNFLKEVIFLDFENTQSKFY